jgi:hypothetical protein
MLKRTLLLTIISITYFSCNFHTKYWTEAYYNASYKYIYDLNGQYIKDTSQRKIFTKYEIDRLKVELPGGLSSVPKDSMLKVCANIGDEYNKTQNTSNLQMTLPWTAEGDKAFKKSVLSGNFIKSVSEKLQDSYCDCMLVEFRKIYPDSISIPVPDSIYKVVIHNCNIKLSVNAHN